ncbi:MAG: PEP-CTERM sorting domain-containing protein [Bryobacteraceae bacterium]
MTTRLTIFAAPLLFAGVALSATIQTAVDQSPSLLVPGPNSSALQSSFLGGLSSSQTIDFESLSTGVVTNFSPLSGVTVALTNVTGSFDSITNSSDQFLGFNTTPAGSNFLSLEIDETLPAPQPDLVAHFHFATPISAFGFYLTGAGTGAGHAQLEFTDGNGLNTYPLTSTDQYPESSVIYVAVTGLNGSIQDFYFRMIADLDIDNNLTIGDIVGIDDVTFQADAASTPEPSTILLAAAGGLALWLRRR